MTKYLERQLEHQKQLLYLDIPSLRKHNKLLSKFCKTSKYASSNDDSSYDEENDTGFNHYSYENDSVEMGALPTPASEVANVAVKKTFTSQLYPTPLEEQNILSSTFLLPVSFFFVSHLPSNKAHSKVLIYIYAYPLFTSFFVTYIYVVPVVIPSLIF